MEKVYTTAVLNFQLSEEKKLTLSGSQTKSKTDYIKTYMVMIGLCVLWTAVKCTLHVHRQIRHVTLTVDGVAICIIAVNLTC